MIKFGMIKFDYIQEFITLAETLSFSKTAELNFITQPALSRHIAMLEKEMGTNLLIRNTRNVKLTPAGTAVYDSFRKILSTFLDAKEQASFLSSGKKGVIKISSPYYWTEDHTEPLIQRFQKAHPYCDIHLISCQPDEGMQELYKGRSDICINIYSPLFTPELPNNVRYIPFAREKFGVLLNADHPLAKRKSIKLKELKNETFVLIRGRDKHNNFILGLLEKRGIEPACLKYTQQIDTVGMTIKLNGGVSIMPYGTRHMDRSYIKVVSLEDKDCDLPMCIYYCTDNDNPVVTQFINEAKN